MTRRNGFTLIETLIVLVVLSLTGLIAIPRFRDALSLNNLRGSRAKTMSLFSTARAAATSSGRPTYLHAHGNRVYVTAIGRRKPGLGTQDTITAVQNLLTQYGVALASSQDSIRIEPSGVGSTAAQIRLTKGHRVDTIEISQYGRVIK